MLTREEIRVGDTVRLEGGVEVRVRGFSDSYHDRAGEHPGPWVIVHPYERHLLSEVAEVVVRNERVCRLCGGGVDSTNPAVDFCRTCHYTGAAQSDSRAEQIARFKAALPGFKVAVEHTGGGCFWLAFYPADRAADGFYYAATGGEASLPATDAGDLFSGGWGAVCRYPVDEEHPEYDGRLILTGSDPDSQRAGYVSERYWEEYPKHARTDDEVIAAIRADLSERSI